MMIIIVLRWLFQLYCMNGIFPQQGVHARVYFNGYAYPSLPAYFGQSIMLNEDTGSNASGTDYLFHKARIQYLSKNPYLCDRSNIVVFDNTTSSDYNVNNSIFVPPSPIKTILSLDNRTNLTVYNEEDVPAALLVVRGNCDFIQKALVAQSIHPSIGVLFISDNKPNERHEVPMRGHDEGSSLPDTRLMVLSLTNITGMELEQYIIDETAEIVEGGPLILFDGWLPFDHPVVTGDSSDPSLYSVANWTLFLIAIIIICSCLLLPLIRHLIYGPRPNNAGTTNSSGSTTDQPPRRLLTKEEVLQFTTSTIRSKPSTNTTGTTTATNDSGSSLLPAWYTSTISSTPSTIPEKLETDDHDDQCCAICLGELEYHHQDDTITEPVNSSHPISNVFADESSVTTSGNHNNNNNSSSSSSSAIIAQLPCYHTFHLSCIVPWLTERQSYCPLCKYDLLHYFDNTNNNSNTNTVAATDSNISSTA